MNDSLQLFDKQLSIVTKPIPKITNPQDVLVKITYSGVSETDLHILAGEYPTSSKAVTLGHEFCGYIHSVGSDVSHVAVGDRVVINPNNNCNICSYCTQGAPHFCKTGSMHSTVGIWKNGGWASYCRVAGSLVYKIPNEIPTTKAIFMETLSRIASAWKKLGCVKPNTKVLVCGGSTMGVLWSSFFHSRGFFNVSVTDDSEKRRTILSDLRLGLQVHHPDYLIERYSEALREADDDWGFDVIVDCTGSSETIEHAFKWLRRGSKLLLFGFCPQKEKIRLSPFEMYYKEIKIIGCFNSPYAYSAALSLVRSMSDYLDYKKLGVNTYELNEYSAALEDLKNGIISKAVFMIKTIEE